MLLLLTFATTNKRTPPPDLQALRGVSSHAVLRTYATKLRYLYTTLHLLSAPFTRAAASIVAAAVVLALAPLSAFSLSFRALSHPYHCRRHHHRSPLSSITSHPHPHPHPHHHHSKENHHPVLQFTQYTLCLYFMYIRAVTLCISARHVCTP